MLNKYDVLVEINGDSDNWKHIDVWAADKFKARLYAIEELQKDGVDVVHVIKIQEIS